MIIIGNSEFLDVPGTKDFMHIKSIYPPLILIEVCHGTAFYIFTQTSSQGASVQTPTKLLTNQYK